MSFYKTILLLFCFVGVMQASSQQILDMKSGEIVFTSAAPLETIKAKSNRMLGIMDLTSNKFAFSVDILSFQGFNSELQREHFGENYMETDRFPKATFQGKLIDKFNPGLAKQVIRAKGQFEIHGVAKERIIDVEITKFGDGYKIKSDFNVSLVEHNINIPKIVFQRIAEIIQIGVSGALVPRS
jgi:hypothetical protein